MYRAIVEEPVYNAEFDLWLSPDVEFQSDAVEPDLLANWLARGWIVDASLPVPEPEVIEAEDSEEQE